MATRSVFCHVPPAKMPLQSQDSPLGAFLKAFGEEKIECILIGAMAAIEQGAPLMTVHYDFWVRLPERQYVRCSPSSIDKEEQSEPGRFTS